MLALVTVPAVANADRGATLGITGGGAIMGDANAIGPDRLGTLVAASLSWEQPAPEYPDQPGTARGRGQLIPEATVIGLGDRGGVLGGVRAQLDVAQRSMGLFAISARMSIWFAGRLGLVQGAQSPIWGGDFGEIFYGGHQGWRAGMVVGVLTWKETGSDLVPIANGGGAVPVAFKAEAPGSQQLAITFGIVVAK